MLDDFTQGGFTMRLTMTQFHTYEEGGLDRAHSAWGHRALTTHVNSNPNNTYLDVTVGGGRQRFESPVPVMWDSRLQLGGAGPEVDLSAESEIWVDLRTEHPSQAQADNWMVTVRDAHGRGAGNGGWLYRPEGIRFRRQGFAGTVDWSRIVAFQFTQNWDSLPNPLAYEVTRIYAVPEPSLFVAVVAGLVALRKHRATSQVR